MTSRELSKTNAATIMGIINDIYDKVRYWKPIVYAPAERLICSKCGKEYVSRGKHDIGICRDCEREQNAVCIGGVYDGEKAHDGN